MTDTASNIYTRDCCAYVSSMVNAGEKDPTLRVSDTLAFAHVQAASIEIARELRGRDITIFTKQTDQFIRIPPGATSITSSQQYGTTFTGAGLDDATFSGTYTGTDAVSFTVVVTATGTFKWKKNDGAYTTGVAMTGSAQALSDGISVTWGATTGHTIGDYTTYMIYFYPSDLVRPTLLRARYATTPTEAAGTYQQMTMSDGFVPVQDEGQNRQLYDWRKQEIVFVDLTTTTDAGGIRDVLILYEFNIPILRLPYDLLRIPEGYSVVAFRGAAFAFAAVGKGDRSNACMEASKAGMERIVMNERAIRSGTGTAWGQPVTV